MEEKRERILPDMAVIFLLTQIFFCGFSPVLAIYGESEAVADNSAESSFQTYIVHVMEPNDAVLGLESYYQSFFPDSIDSSEKQSRMVHSYNHVITGFAAKLTAEEVKSMEKREGFILARPQKLLSLQTTRTPYFLGLSQNLGFWNGSNYGKGVIIGMVDSGVIPSHPSFSDEGMPPPPAKWKGKCDFNVTICNNKIIGARTILSTSKTPNSPPFDSGGHGTHTASTAAGNFVKGANVFGFANGTSSGMAPLAHLAIYKVCGTFSCPDSDVLAAIDTAVGDGVDVISLSLGSPAAPFFEDVIAIGAFGAIRKGVFVSCAGGNFGEGFSPYNGTVTNAAPWVLTVGASTHDRRIITTAKLGNGIVYEGQSLSLPNGYPTTFLPLVFPGMSGNLTVAACLPGSLQNIDVKGKIVLCEPGGYGFYGFGDFKGQEVKDAGGVGMIVTNYEQSGNMTYPTPHVLPATAVSYAAGLDIKAYINSTSTPTATLIFNGTVIGDPSAPTVAAFSSRGPNQPSPGILKPDIIAPGVDVLAAFPVTSAESTNSNMTFAFLSGTSMACPHLSGIAALLKSSHPDWSPAAIKSAIITSADFLNRGGNPITDHMLQPANLFAIGAGLVNPSRANDPGLVYDVEPDEYIPYLCGLGYEDNLVGVIVHKYVSCSKETSIQDTQLNYPSFSILLGADNQTYTRTVTNVGEAKSSYTVQIIPPQGVDVIVKPLNLDFSEGKQKKTFSVTFVPTGFHRNISIPITQGALTWVSADNTHHVRSPIAIIFK